MKFNKLIAGILTLALSSGLFTIPISAADSTLLAFPGAEGGGKYTLGARNSTSMTVYHVTNLNSSGMGSFADAVSKSNRIIVFDVGGTIDMKGSTLKINGSNLTILGQTAPGDGITVTGGDMVFANKVEQVIMRYIRVRPTDKYGGEPDGIGGRWNNNIIIDHCSTSWSVDELLTLYAGSSESDTPGAHLTVQNTLASESLRMSNHFKGAHGYGGIFGATYSTWYHNLLAHHDSRSPRLDRELNHTDVRNNVIYDWGQTNSAYGGEPYSYNNVTQNGVYVNYANNYYKYGPATKPSLRNRIFQLSELKDASVDKAQFYFKNNYVYGDETVTNDNTQGLYNPQYATLLTTPLSMGDYEISNTTETAQETYNEILEDVGATLPKRDAIDARIIDDVKNQSGRIINNADEVGGVITTGETTKTFSIPSDWKTENGMGTAAETDIITSGTWKGYTWLEAYVNDWTQKQSSPTNPSITVTSPATQNMNSLGTNNEWAVINDNEALAYSAQATPVSGTTITKVEIYDGSKLIKTVSGATVNESLTLSSGTHYLTSRAYNSKGESTQSDTSIVYVNGTSGIGSYTHAQIGTTNAFDGKGGAWSNGTVYTVAGSGNLISTNGQTATGIENDSCDFMYKSVEGDFDYIVKREQIPKFENGSVCGIMLRESLDKNSRMAMLADGWLKYGENVSMITRTTTDSNSVVQYFKNSSETAVENNSNYDTSKDEYKMPEYLRVQRSGDNITFSVSNDGKTWTDNPRQPETITIDNLSETLYLGIAVDSVQGTPMKEYMAQASFDLVSEEPELDEKKANTFTFTSDFLTGSEPYVGPFSKTVKDSDENDIYTVTALKQSETDTSKVWKFSGSYFTGSENPKDASMTSVSEANVNASVTAPTYGTVIKLTPHMYGKINVKYKLGTDKILMLVKTKAGEADGTVIDKSEKNTTGSALESSIDFTANVGYDYYIYALGSKLSYGDITFTPWAVQPTPSPTATPTIEPIPTIAATATPTIEPTPTVVATATPTIEATPTVVATATPTIEPTPTIVATATPTIAPIPTIVATATPTIEPSEKPIIQNKAAYDKASKKAIITSSAEIKSAVVIFADYDLSGKLTSVSIKQNVDLSIGNNEIAADKNFDDSSNNVRIFVWESLNGMKPIM